MANVLKIVTSHTHNIMTNAINNIFIIAVMVTAMEDVYEYKLSETADVCFMVAGSDPNADCPVEFPFEAKLLINGNVWLNLWKK